MSLLKYKEYERRIRDQATTDGMPEAPNPMATLNEATIKSLCMIKGIGPKTAERIKKNGPYNQLGEWIEKAKISKKIADKIVESLGLRSA